MEITSLTAAERRVWDAFPHGAHVGQEKAFNPLGWYQWLSYLLIVTGWLLATTIAAGITRSVSRQ
ncbi:MULTISPECIES: hypothetical protein [unclassified Streptomyces]|uniref:hypothetical protein n=1 Tax=unclassified Streptomyces TaxID=2593676 RepID=UPI000CD58617|nr:hypothetical protein [Streptomyces sp. SM10]